MCMFINYTLIAVSMSEFVALRDEVKHLMELIEKLISEFRAVKLKVEASHIDMMESVQLAIGLCRLQCEQH